MNFVWQTATNGDWWDAVDWNAGGAFPYGFGDTVDLSVAGSPFTITMLDGTISTQGGGSLTINGYEIGYLKVGADATLLAQTSFLDLTAGAANSGTIIVDYALQVGYTTANVVKTITSLTGATGHIVLNGATGATLSGHAAGIELDLHGQSVEGSGSITNIRLKVFEDSRIDANVAGQVLTLNTGDAILNDGVIGATTGGTLSINGSSIVQAPLASGDLSGAISAADKSFVVLTSDHVYGGAISESGSGLVQINDQNNVFDGSTHSGALTFTNGMDTQGYNITLKGAISNEGSLNVHSGTVVIDAFGVILDSAGSATKGQIQLSGGALNIAATAVANALLDNVDNQIHGYGAIYNLDLINGTAGVINADVSGETLSIGASDLLQNKGTLKATNGGNLNLAGQTLDASLGGRVFSGQFSKIYISSDTFLGGLQYGEFAFQDQNNIFDGSTTAGAVTFVNPVDTGGYNITLKGAIHNQQEITTQGGTVEIDAAGVTLDSAGTTNTNTYIYLAGGAINSATNTAQRSALDIAKTAIKGYGALYNLKFTNDAGGVVNANVAGQTLSIGGSDSLINKGLLEATNGGTLGLSSQSLDEALGGSVTAGANSIVSLSSMTFLGGALTVASGGEYLFQDQNNIFDGSTASGAVKLAQSLNTGGYNFTLKGTLHNKGTLAMQGGTLEIDAAGATLDSGGATIKGQVSLTGGAINITASTPQFSSLNNIDNGIIGYGNFYNLTFTNGAGGVVNADVAGQALSLGGSNSVINKGLLEATNGGTLGLSSQTLDGALGGSVTAGANSTVALSSMTFLGGALTAASGGKYLFQDQNNIFDGSTASGAVTLAQSLDTGGYNFTLKGTLHNKGTLTTQGGTLEIDAAGATLDSGGATTPGKVSLAGGYINSLTNAAQGSLLDNVDNRIYGYGTFYNLKFTNEAAGAVNANVSGQTISVGGSNSVTNKGVLEATAGGALDLSGGYLFNAGGTIWADGGAVNLSSIVVRQGTLKTTGASKIVIADTNVSLDNGNVTDGLTLAGDVVVSDGVSLSMAGSILDNGHIYLGDANGGSALYIGATLDGTGSIVMAVDQANVISGGFNNVNSTIVGGGQITAVIQQAAKGVIDATGALTLNSGHAIANAGLLEAVAGSLTVDDAVSGTGKALVTGGGALSFASTFNQNVTFQGAGLLSLGQTYSGVLSGFTIGDRLDLTNIAYSAGERLAWLSAAAGVQSFAVKTAAGALLETIHFKGDYSPSFFSVADNGGFAEITVKHAPLSAAATNSFNGDATSDLLWTNVANSDIQSWTMLKGAEYSSHTGPALSSGYALAGTGDFSGDGTTDLLLYNATSGAAQEWDMAAGVYSNSHVLGTEAPSTGWGVAGVGDFNGDGNADVFWVNNATNQAMVWEERSDARIGTTTMTGPGAGWNVIGTGDFNADGVTDALWENTSTRSVMDWQMSNGTLKSTSILGTVAAGSTFAGVGDFDGKGADEVLFQSSTGALSAWQIVNGANVGTLPLASTLPAGFAVAKVGDFNGDGVSDVLLYNSSTGAVDVGLVSGGAIASWAAVGAQAAAQWHLSA